MTFKVLFRKYKIKELIGKSGQKSLGFTTTHYRFL